eukprot:m.11667 g.11667  ORF g.11667 m.11667 type:complete len:605 (-) comp4467_c0_seq1:176-1990(-)
MDLVEITEKVIYTSRVEWDAFLHKASDDGALKLVLVVDPVLTTRVDQISGGFSHLQELGVVQVFPLSPTMHLSNMAGQRNVFVLSAETTVPVEHATKALDTAGHERRKAIVGFLPCINLECTAILEEGGVLGKVIVDKIPIPASPFAPDALAMPTPDFFHGCFGELSGGGSHCGEVAEALYWLCSIIGPSPVMHAVGSCAEQACGLAAAAMSNKPVSSRLAPFEGTIVVDRSVDLVSPLCNQLTYSGMVDETWGDDLGTARFGPDIVEGASKEKPTRVAMYRGIGDPDAIFESVKDRNFAEVGPLLTRQAKELGASYDERHGATDLADIKKFVSKLGGLKAKHRSLQTHINISTALLQGRSTDAFTDLLELQLQIISGTSPTTAVDAVLERIHRQEPMIPVLQLVCLMATAQLPLRPRDWDTVLTAFYQSYGYAHLATTARLCGTGILRPAAGDPKTDPKAESFGVPPPPAVPVFKFKAARKKFKLVQGTSSSGAEADDELYQALFGYMPLLAAIVDRVADSGADSEDMQKILAPCPSACFRDARYPVDAVKNGIWLVVIIGGVTSAELAVMRRLAHSKGRKFLFLTTGLCTAERLLRGAMRVS